ncbi:N-acetylneuraminate lyase [Natronincola ferrireducens]|uniref:N-acetylneuraminate lyase n=1 Tax=Natronincola ferrireducens TaxID=393762 RepID=A0A1G9A5I2_9FIRM|nr:N-acetylneuraminate lyase [Natronincola ferrireducens]SDK22639.1 N-acetylneuraminate lyase [Natronincola ferrireducens]
MKGIFTALITPFHGDGKINEKGLRQVVRHNIDKMGVHGLYVGGSTGENFLLSKETKKEIFSIVKEEVGTQVKLIAQIGSLNIEEAIELGKYATDLGYDALSSVTPYYYKFSFNEIKNYYLQLIEATGNKMIIYSIPVLTGVNFSLGEFDQILNLPNVIGVKFTDSDFVKLERLKRLYPEKTFLFGFDEIMLAGCVFNADGAIGSTYNVMGDKAVAIYNLVQEEKIKEAMEIQSNMNQVIEVMIQHGVYQSIKEILKLKGIDGGHMKFPFSELSGEGKEEVKKIMELI